MCGLLGVRAERAVHGGVAFGFDRGRPQETSCQPPPIRAGLKPDTLFRVRFEARCSIGEDTPSTKTAPRLFRKRAGLPRLGPGVSAASAIGATHWSLRPFLRLVSPRLILWFDPRRGHSSVPTTAARAHRAQPASRLARRATALGLDAGEHGASLTLSGARAAHVAAPGVACGARIVFSTAPAGTIPSSR